MRVLIVDDEAPARERLHRMLDEIGDYEVVGEASNGEEALISCAALQPATVLLDIRMPGMSGIDIARHLDALDEPPAVIFTTAYDQYAVEAFETEAVGYLLKPIRKEKLAYALRHAARLSPTRLAKLAHTAQITHKREQICVRLGEQLKLIPVGDIYCFIADQKYVTVRHQRGEDLIDEALKALSEEFAETFVRIHRNALVAEKYIDGIERVDGGRYTLKVRETGQLLEVSRRHAPELMRRLRK
jgi:two-component system, LytTR family, response regulator AlgR